MRRIVKNLKVVSLSTVLFLGLYACNSGQAENQKAEENDVHEEAVEEKSADPMTNKGIGPVSSVTLGDIDPANAKKGEELFTSKCSACHALDKKVVGPPLADLTKRRTPEWIMNMILNPEQMVKEDPIAKELLGEYLAPMANQSLTKDEARNILEYFRQNDK